MDIQYPRSAMSPNGALVPNTRTVQELNNAICELCEARSSDLDVPAFHV